MIKIVNNEYKDFIHIHVIMSILVITVDHPDKTVEDELIAKYQKKIYELEDDNGTHKDSGFDLLVPELLNIEEDDTQITIDHAVKAVCYSYPELEPLPFYLYPRSSISRTPFRMANSVGIIDSGYRGNLLAKVDVIDRKDRKDIGKQSRLFQICSHNLLPFKKIQLVDKSDKRFRKKATSRDTGGFGSTSK